VIETVSYRDGVVRLLDQTRLPLEVVTLECTRVEEVADAIRRLAVRGAPALGVAAAYGLVLGLAPHREGPRAEFLARLEAVHDLLASTRPTAANLRWALDRLARAAGAHPGEPPARLWQTLLEEAHAIRREDEEQSRAIGAAGAALLSDGDTVLTHCNAGGLATAGLGTALAVVYAAVEEGKRIRVLADETRPLFQGSRLTAWELSRSGIPVAVLCDGAAPSVMAREGVKAVIVGADRIAANGDFANKIGTFGVALAARHHAIPFYVAAPSSTLDLSIASGREIPIEERAPEEVLAPLGTPVAPPGVTALNPAFDVTPAEFVTAFILERGVVRPPFGPALQAAYGRRERHGPDGPGTRQNAP
jgi:methylthioribose-1-phosphate isomerase